ncbi:hypothetical protein MVEG_04237 [Podila verticillata NRRL 6337]|nr:hypothetical protein MVEG_04237 [Podila verticillata NRRL 6337]
MHSSTSNTDEPAMDYRHASISSSPIAPRAAPAGLAPVVTTTSPQRQQPPRQHTTAPAVSKIVDITLPSPISAKAALRMVQITVKTLMYMRGLLSSPWEQLEMLVKMDQQEQEEQGEQDQEELDLDHVETLRARGTPSRSIKLNPSLRKPLQDFLESGERMFSTLEEVVYDQQYQQLKKARGPQPKTPFSNSTIASTELASSSPPPPSPSVLSLALIFGTTLLTPKEQYMIHIGPLKPKQPFSATTSSVSVITSNDQANDENKTDHARDEALRNQLQRMERQWERRLVQDLMGIRIMDGDTSTTVAQDPLQTHFLETGASTLPKTKVLLLMKAKAGQIIDGMLPKLALDLQEDFAPAFSSPSPTPSSSISSTCNTSKKPIQKRKRWPIHHIRVMGPQPEFLQLDDGGEDNIWYQVGPGLPSMPNL